MASPYLSWELWDVTAVVDENTKSNIMIFVFAPLWDGQHLAQHLAQYQVQKYTVMYKNIIKENEKLWLTLKYSGSVFGSPKRLES